MKKEFFTNFIEKIKDIFLYASRVLIILEIALMVFIPFLIKNTSFKGNDVIVYNKVIDIMAIDGKTNVKISDTYFSTTISYDKYESYIKSYNNSSYGKNVLVLELLCLFILFEFICFYYVMVCINNIYYKEESEYVKYVSKRSFIINIVTILLTSLFRRFIFRNTIFSSLDLSMFFLYAFSVFMFIITYSMIIQNGSSKGKLNEKN